MGHLLETVNPDAAAVIDGEFEVIQVGMPVLFRARAGSMRAGRTSFFASVMKQNQDDGSVDLLVMMEPEDFVEERHVRRFSEQQQTQVWEPIVPSLADFNALAERLSALEKNVLGPFRDPPMALMEYMDNFDKRLRALEKKGK